ncbi:hypothetical protein KQI18_02240 [Clostridioides mangenotii]|uniref:hypothetical protein n=1 Tax=Metaclostridioides mangenotii TaxID=1540 RepID=UPI001C0FE82C|nr:hypothetical protein [Clostridioides mangenotii]MBU5306595.1 hypothetical protein [Clostridioides mangenotii]
MKSSKGFVAIECVVSLSILIVSVYLVSTALQNCYRHIKNNEKNREMLNLAKSNLENQKYKIKNNESEEIQVKSLDIGNNQVGDYVVSSTVTSNSEFVKNYKINVKVIGNRRTLELVSYVTKH